MNNIAVLVFACMINGILGLKCYTCSTTEDDSDTTCLDNPGSIEGQTTDCDKKYCIIVRLDYKDPRGKMASLVRNCVDKPTYINEVIEDETHRTYYRSCRQDLCNGGSGRTDSDSQSGKLGDKSTIYCPGIGKSRATLSTLTISTFVLIFCHLLV